MKPRLMDMTVDELGLAAAELGEPRYRADQLADWVFAKGVTDTREMSNLPAGFAGKFDVLTSRVEARRRAGDGTTKLLLCCEDGAHVETVLIPDRKRATACLSTQVGCAIGCSFCASGLGGLERNLSGGEILQQFLHLWQQTGRRPTHAVFMGMGEPLANYDATVAAVRGLIDARRFGLSARRITVSTVGLPRQMRRLAAENLAITLAISLHGPNDALRRQLIPAADRAGLEEILSAAERFYCSRKREVTLEYLLLAGVNDTKVCAEALAQIARRLRCNVNLIRYNPVPALKYARPSAAAVEAFARRLRRRKVNVQVRRSRGLDADAACGQLRRQPARQSMQ